MSNLIQFFKDNFKIIFSTVLIYQLLLTIFFFSTENLVILSVVTAVFSCYIIITTYKDDIVNFFKK